jgi:hypothetical protein
MLKHFILPFLILGSSCSTTSPNKLEDQIIKSKDSIVKNNCDDLWFQRKIEIINALKANEERIKTFTDRKNYSEEEFNIISFGPIVIREPKIETSALNRWSDYSTDWMTLYKFYQTIQGKPVDKDWIELSRTAQSLVMNDERRLVRFYNFNLTEKSYSKLIEVQSILARCMADTACNDLKLSEGQISFLNETPLYSYFYKKYLASTTIDQKKYASSKILQWIKFDIESRFSFSKNPKVKKEGDYLVLPLKTGDFESVKDELSMIIEEAWSSKIIQIKIKWLAENDDTSPVYKFIADRSANGRSFTSERDHTITIANTAKKKSIIHEIGHALGFKEYYYEIFNPNVCGYTTRKNSQNIMSDINHGIVTEEMFYKLKEEYLINL